MVKQWQEECEEKKETVGENLVRVTERKEKGGNWRLSVLSKLPRSVMGWKCSLRRRGGSILLAPTVSPSWFWHLRIQGRVRLTWDFVSSWLCGLWSSLYLQISWTCSGSEAVFLLQRLWSKDYQNLRFEVNYNFYCSNDTQTVVILKPITNIFTCFII